MRDKRIPPIQCYENLVDMEVDFDDDLFLELATLAHERDVTFNELINYLIGLAIENEKNNLPD